jgi:plastocyanin
LLLIGVQARVKETHVQDVGEAGSMTSKRTRLALLGAIVAVSLGLLVAACDDDENGGGGPAETAPASNGATATEPDGSTDGEPTDVTSVGEQVQIAADNLTAFDTDELTAPAGEPFTVTFDNRDTGIPHNWALYASEDDAGDPDLALAATEIESAPDVQSVVVPALDPGEYYFQCDVHPNMNGTLTAE